MTASLKQTEVKPGVAFLKLVASNCGGLQAISTFMTTPPPPFKSTPAPLWLTSRFTCKQLRFQCNNIKRGRVC